MTYKLTVTIELSGEEYPVLEAAGRIDEVLEGMGTVDARHPDDSPARISGTIEGAGPVAIATRTVEARS